jgi:hypothetical protein
VTRFISNARAEERAEERVAEYQRRFGEILEPPVPLELMLDHVFDLGVLWEPISTEGGLSPLAGIRPRDRLIVLNEERRRIFDQYPGLLQFTYGHEIGHWDLHVDQASLVHPSLEGFEPAGAFQHHRSPGGVVEVLVSRLHKLGLSPPEIHETVAEVTRGMDSFFEARQVNRYTGALLMPRALVLRAVDGRDLTSWRTLYELRDRFQVTISALTIRLQNLGLIYVADDRTIHRSRAEYMGQMKLL